MQKPWSIATFGTILGLFIVCAPVGAAPSNAYLKVEPEIATWLPTQPEPGDITDDADLTVYYATRPRAAPGTASLAAAHADDVLSAAALAQQFASATGGALDTHNAPLFLTMMGRVLDDDGAMLAPVKKDVAAGGRVRPFVRFPEQNACDHIADDRDYHLNETGSYPSGHATYGWMWGLILSNLVPERAGPLMAKAYDFGQSRLICGFHYPSDLTAGRLVASALFAQLMADPIFTKDLKRARGEVRKALGLRTMPQ